MASMLLSCKVGEKMPIKKKDREIAYNKYNGHCAYCGKEIEIKGMQIDHIIPVRKGGKDILANFNPACCRCNHYKRTYDIEQFRELIKTIHERIEKLYIVKVAIDFGIITIKQFDGKFHYEKSGNDNYGGSK